MQTFLPFPDFAETAECLDRPRLGKQRVETLQIMKALMTGTGYVNHPVTLMWRRYEWSLLQYQEAICHEWTEVRGFSDTCLDKTRELYFRHCEWTEQYLTPHWMNDRKLHIAYQSLLLRKDIWHYSRYFPDVPLDLELEYPAPADPYIKYRVHAREWAEAWMD